MSRQVAETERQFANLLQIGTVLEVDHARPGVRVDLAGLISGWLQVGTAAAGGTRTWTPRAVGEQVLVACLGGDPANGIVICGIYQEAHPAPAASADLSRTIYPDGAQIEYDHAAHALTATLPAGGSATLTCPGGLTIEGDVTVQGTLTATEDVVAGTISGRTHVHLGVSTGTQVSGVPQP